MDELAQSLEAFGPWDWACVVANLLAAIAGIFALKCWRNLPGKATAQTTSVSDAFIALATGLLSFGIIFGLVTGLVSQAFSTHFGISQAHLFTAAFCGQLTAAAAMLAMGALAPRTLDWAPSLETAEPPPEGSPFRQALRAFSLPRVLLGLLAIFALGLAATLVWKGFHVAWEQLFLKGWAGQPPADEPQEIVDAVLKTDVDTWRFFTIVLAVTIGAPIMEELAFRGMIYPRGAPEPVRRPAFVRLRRFHVPRPRPLRAADLHGAPLQLQSLELSLVETGPERLHALRPWAPSRLLRTARSPS
jgi:membrane protease YdiL (CAAX protease family)